MNRAFAAILLSISMLPARQSAPAPKAATSVTINDFFRDFTAEWVRGNPSLATSARYFTGDEQERLERQLTPESEAYRRTRIQLARRGLAELRKFDQARMTENQRLSADLLKWQLQIVIDEEPYLDFSFPLQQMNGVNNNVVEALTVRHPLANERDAQNYVAALGQVDTRMEEAIARARALEAKKIIPPRFILQATIRQMHSFVDLPPRQNPFVTILVQKMTAIPSIPEARREAISMEAEKVVSTGVYPAWKKAIALLESQLPRSTDEAGISRLKSGPEAYSYFLRRFTTTNLTADQIHQIGLDEVARIEKEMDSIFRRLGRTDGSLQQRIEKLKQDLGYPLTEAGRDLIMKDVRQILSDAQKRSEALFIHTPKSAVVAQPFPRFREANAAANYNAPAPDGSRPGTGRD